MRFMR